MRDTRHLHVLRGAVDRLLAFPRFALHGDTLEIVGRVGVEDAAFYGDAKDMAQERDRVVVASGCPPALSLAALDRHPAHCAACRSRPPGRR